MGHHALHVLIPGDNHPPVKEIEGCRVFNQDLFRFLTNLVFLV
jgi:hypothetical protein